MLQDCWYTEPTQSNAESMAQPFRLHMIIMNLHLQIAFWLSLTTVFCMTVKTLYIHITCTNLSRFFSSLFLLLLLFVPTFRRKFVHESALQRNWSPLLQFDYLPPKRTCLLCFILISSGMDLRKHILLNCEMILINFYQFTTFI